MEEIVRQCIKDSITLKQAVLEKCIPDIVAAAKLMTETLQQGKKILVCGNGGSAADSQHFVTELTIRFEKNRKPLAGLALTTDTSALTACANDFSFEEVFVKQVEALGNSGDLLLGITTSGNSENVLRALKKANEKGLKTVCLNGKTGGSIKNIKTAINLIVPGNSTARIQEAHIMILHIWCKLIEDSLFPDKQ